MPPYADAIASFWKARLASGPRAAERPSLQHLLGNASLPFDLARTRARAPQLAQAIRGDGRRILLIPGLLASEHRMEPLRAVLNAAGYEAHGWGMGRNFGPRPDSLEQIDRRVDAIRRETGAPVTLVGWSLGGLFAREYAKFATRKVGGVVTMGTPFSGDPRANHAWRLYQLVSGFPVDRPPFTCRREEKPPVPTVALWSRRDGVILPRCAKGRAGERDRAIEVDCTHMGFAAAPEGILAVGEALEAMRG
ncbi:alpha/beta fold hydrolase [Sphingobium indicum]|uniref:Alpha/beta hydrolase n=3 Tax=Sphingobium indicum TaxID=332055 RepID=A0A8E0WSE4_9SPHN|nr:MULTISPECIES: alpha/beta fold hydrolase [Sphingobium]EPR16966.1 alpha/beta hydrolase [Sphingobium indicum IP26]KEZ00166.1 alpha/beta hydrolase [Sphingomonas sp. BHC-A]APL95626.1 alpha/beta hydrolase [Sphingobium indicum B90A]EQB04588.1 alpha/beta hydrolase [Sphingobium sp. HDIP04]KER36551.1 alpha/beta hydrolase [Sphingobium indicum F2]